ncbi:diablo IAP-binding mitochondrial protein [Acanthochromis polyacanthus]|uniref:Direct IAP-binding protein with low pI n=1 Tax=Acanthochromis polyacanthus TaxID=80966 RepID=A0A3Q1FFK1_9TELE|nr:diablo IAP-binding mitochondrial protein [Acanthochromis polyacanthus]
MAALRWGTAYVSFVRSSVRAIFSSSKAAVSKPRKWRNVLYTGVASLAVGGGLCAVPFKQVENLSHDFLIRQAASLVTDSSSTFLSQTTLALIDAITEYSKAVHTLIALQRRYLASLGKLTPAEEDSIWQVIIGQRAEINDRQDNCKRLESAWISVVKLCETAAEAAYSSGAEHASVTMSSNIQVALSQVGEAQKLSQDADKKLAETKVLEVQRMAQQAASSEEEEIPEAYLRED